MARLVLIVCALLLSCNTAVVTNVNDNPTNDPDTGATNSRLVVFVDPDSDFFTTDVNDVNEEIVQFDSETQSIIWAADGTSYNPGAWTVDGNFLAGGGFQVRFGSKEGARRAYFTESGPATICDIRADGTNLFIFPTSAVVPEE